MDSVRPLFGERVLGIGEEVMLRWRWLMQLGKQSGRSFPQPDLLLAAAALKHDLVLVTRNTRDFSGLGLALHNPWSAQA